MKSSFIKIEYSQPAGLTYEARLISLNLSNALSAYVGTSIFVSRKFEVQYFKKFIHLKERWKSETLFTSSGSLIISNSAYQEIIGFGMMAVPWIIREMKRTDEHWFYALEKITGVNPIRKENIGNIDEMKKDWINWASNF